MGRALETRTERISPSPSPTPCPRPRGTTKDERHLHRLSDRPLPSGRALVAPAITTDGQRYDACLLCRKEPGERYSGFVSGGSGIPNGGI